MNTGYNIYKDGDMWCAVEDTFIDVTVSKIGFGDTPVEALQELLVVIEIQEGK